MLLRFEESTGFTGLVKSVSVSAEALGWPRERLEALFAEPPPPTPGDENRPHTADIGEYILTLEREDGTAQEVVLTQGRVPPSWRALIEQIRPLARPEPFH